jgi:hypothetical protein
MKVLSQSKGASEAENGDRRFGKRSCRRFPQKRGNSRRFSGSNEQEEIPNRSQIGLLAVKKIYFTVNGAAA